MRGPEIRKSRAVLCGVAAALAFSSRAAQATDEIQVYNAEIAEVGQWTLEQHLNYVARGRTQPDFPGGLIPNHSLNGTPEPAFGVTDWWEMGCYAPFSVDNGAYYSDGAKLRTLFVSPDAAKRDFFYGINFEYSYETPLFSQTRAGIEVRPIIGFRTHDFEFIVNPIVDIGVGAKGISDFAPAAKLSRKVTQDFALGLEYYADFGQIGQFASSKTQQHTLFAVTDFKIGDFDFNLGVGHGFTPGTDRLVFKAIVGYAFPAPEQPPAPSWSQRPF